MTDSPNGTTDDATEAGEPAVLTGARAIIELGALAANWRAHAGVAAGAECGAVLKADAYGIGLVPAGRTLWNVGARTFFVALGEEGRRLREALPEATIFVLNGATADDLPFLYRHRLAPFLSSAEEIYEIAAAARAAGRELPVAINVDTGMNRLGIALERAESWIAEGLPEGISPLMVASHLACGDDPAHPMNAAQLGRFSFLAATVRRRWPDVKLSLANSAGILMGPEYHFDLARPGIALYGARAIADRPPLRLVVTLEARILQVRAVAAGETVGYGAAQTMRRDGRVAIASIGYADGFPRAAGGSDGSPGATVMVGRTRCPLIGRVSMDLIAIDVTDCPPGGVARGAWVEIFGEAIPVDEAAAAAGTIGYEFLANLSRRAPRVYIPPRPSGS